MPNYRDIDFNLGIIEQPNGNWINIKSDAYDIIQSLKNIVLSDVGEVPFKSYGVGTYNYLFEYFTNIDKQFLESNIKNRVNAVEPRIQIQTVNAYKQGNQLHIQINADLLLNPKINKNINLTLNPI